MARFDMIGMFWNDEPPPKPPKKEKAKSIPPDRFWEVPGYVVGLAEALEYAPNLYSDMELIAACQAGENLVYDIEVYPNYCLFAFKGIDTQKVVYFEVFDWGWDHSLLPKLEWILRNFCILNFNGRKFDFPVTTLALKGLGPECLWDATQMLIEWQLGSKEVYKKYKTKSLEINQIDLIELTALAPGLKVCAGRLHAQKMQDLPFKPGTVLTPDQIIVLRYYCINDLDNTELLYRATVKQIELRAEMSKRFGVDLRSLSDAQMAEAIISAEVKRSTGKKYISRTEIPPGTRYKYQAPAFVSFSTPLMNHVLQIIKDADFEVDDREGNIILPPSLSNLVIEINKGKYKIGIGGLHSQEKSVAHVTDDEYLVIDTDATSYYPFLILNAGITPPNLGRNFTTIFSNIVNERVAAKHAGNNIVADCLKIVVNGTFGKLGSKWSIVYAPNLLIQVTITGQLAILMLAERFELAGIEVTSVNTDGIMVKCHRSLEAVFHGIVKQWEIETGLGTEETRYRATYSRDINNYFAIYEEPQKGEMFKTKGVFSKTNPKKNAVTEICVEAAKEFIANGTPVRDTLLGCKDIRRFTAMRRVKYGAIKAYESDYHMIYQGQGQPMLRGGIKSGEYLGKIIRWYYAVGVEGDIVCSRTGNRVARSEGAKPLMNLPAEFPTDIDYDWYEDEVNKILVSIGYLQGEIADEELPETVE